MAVCPQWENSVGAQVSRIAWPVAIVGDGVLVIRAATPEWKGVLETSGMDIVRRLNAFESDATKFRRFLVIGPRQEIPKAPPSRRRQSQGKAS